MRHKHYKERIAWAEGEIIQERPPGGHWDTYNRNYVIQWVDHYEYRVKPEPLVMYANIYPDGFPLFSYLYRTKKAAERRADSGSAMRIAVKMVEAQDE